MNGLRTFIRIVFKKQSVRLGLILCSWMLCLWGGERSLAQSPDEGSVLKPTIFVNIDATTWKTRGRFLYDLEGTILKKVSLAGFQVVRDVTQPHECELLVVYREERGEQYRIDSWGTTIRGDFRFSGMALSHPASWTIVENSRNIVFGSPPYLDALMNFETHPYYFFLGEVLRYVVEQDGQMKEGLLKALEQRITWAYPPSSVQREDATVQDHFMESSNVVYQDLAFQRAFEELRLQGYSEQTLVPMARKVLSSPARALRLQAVQLLASAQDFQSCSRVKGIVKQDADPEVLTQVQPFLAKCPSS